MENSDHMLPVLDDPHNQSLDIGEFFDDNDELPEDDDLDGTNHMMSQSHAQVNGSKELSKPNSHGPSRYPSGPRNASNTSSSGHTSMPVLTLSNLAGVMGPTKTSTLSKTGYQRAKAHQRHMSLKKAAKEQRRSEVKSSLSHFLHQHRLDGESDEEEEEDDSLISDEEDHEKRNDADNRSIGSGIRRRRRTSDDGSVGSRSMTSRRRAPRRRLKGDNDDATISSVGSRSRRRTSRRVRDISDDQSVGSVRRRRQGETQKPEGSARRRKRTTKVADEESKPPQRESEELKISGKPDQESARKNGTPRSKLRKKADGDGSGDRSHTRTRKADDPKRKSEKVAKSEKKAESHKPSIPSPPSSSPPPEVNDDDDNLAEALEHKDKVNSLASHLAANVKIRDEKDAEDASEESSRFSFGYQQTLLQFDPTNVDNVARVRQDEANMTSETIRHADGTESELQIRELDGLLPRFENQNDLNASGFSLNPQEIEDASDGSVSISVSTDEDPIDDGQVNDEAPSSARSQDMHDQGNTVRPEPDRKRGLKKTRSAKLRGLFSRRKKKGKDHEDEESSGEESKGRFGRKKKKDKCMQHALLNDDSDASN